MSVSIVAEASSLSVPEADRRRELESVIESGLQTFHEVGNALLEIRESRLYRDSHQTFEKYCEHRWGFTDRRARQLMGAAETVNGLKETGTIVPVNEGQARALAKFDPDLQPAVMKVATAFSNATGKPLTAGMLERTGDVLTEAATTGHVDTGSGESAAFWAAVVAQEYEATQRQQTYLEEKRRRNEEERARIAAAKVYQPNGTYQVVVVDPPWPMQKIERHVRPNQVGFDYPTMTEEELRAFPLPEICDSDCHLFMWTTQKFMPLCADCHREAADSVHAVGEDAFFAQVGRSPCYVYQWLATALAEFHIQERE